MSEELIQRVERAGISALEEIADLIMEKAAAGIGVGDPLVDPDPAYRLADHGYVEPDGKGYIVIFRGIYAAKQHEDQTLKHPRGGGSKFLEKELLAALPTVPEIVASRIHASLDR